MKAILFLTSLLFSLFVFSFECRKVPSKVLNGHSPTTEDIIVDEYWKLYNDNGEHEWFLTRATTKEACYMRAVKCQRIIYKKYVSGTVTVKRGVDNWETIKTGDEVPGKYVYLMISKYDEGTSEELTLGRLTSEVPRSCSEVKSEWVKTQI